jgi:hypothetical protein
MVRKSVYRSLAVMLVMAGVIAGGVPAAHAVVQTTGCADAAVCTMAELLNGGTIVVNDKAFTGFTLDGTNIPGENLASIFVTGLDADPLNVGLAYIGNGELSVTGEGTTTLQFHFVGSVLLGSPFRISGHTLALADAVGDGTGAVSVDGTILDLGLNPLTAQHVDLTAPAAQGAFAQQSSVIVNNLITVTSGDVDSSASLNTLAQLFAQERAPVPEPGIVALFGLGIAGVEVIRRRIRK